MRDPRRKSAKHVRRQRRAILAIILMAGSSAVMADGLPDGSLGNLPPLPLVSVKQTQHVKGNPFCEKSGTDETVQLASSGKGTSIRLKPIGKAVGLQSIESSQPKRVEARAMIIEPVGSAEVRKNPLIESVHHNNQELVDTEVVDGGPPSSKAAGTPENQRNNDSAARAGSTITLVTPAPAQPLMYEPAPVITAPTVPPIEVEPSATVQPYLPEQPAKEGKVAAPTQGKLSKDAVSDSQAVFFSLSDRIEPSDAPDTCQSGEADQQLAAGDVQPRDEADLSAKVNESDEAKSIAVQARDDSEAVDGVDSPGNNADSFALEPPVRVADNGPIELEVVKPIVLDDPAAESLEPMEAVIDDQAPAPVAIYQSEPPAVRPVETLQETLHTKRYRPPVAVKAVPLVFERTSKASPSTDHPTIQRVQAMNLSGLELASADGVKPTPLHMSRAQVRSLTVAGEVRGVKVANKNICQVLASGSNQLKLIGTANGVTQLVVWAAADDSGATVRMRTFEIHVRDSLESKGNEMGDKAELIHQSIRKAFPGCSVSVRRHRDQLVVTGRCDTETSAKKIIRMVRKACLVPVQDELVVR